MNRIFKTMLTLSVLLGMVQSVYGGTGEAVLESWNDLLTSAYTSKQANTYTLNKFASYSLSLQSSSYQSTGENITLVIPSNVKFTILKGAKLSVSKNMTINNYGMFIVNGTLLSYQNFIINNYGELINDSDGMFTACYDVTINNVKGVESGVNYNAIFTNKGDIRTNWEGSSYVFTGDGTIYNRSTMQIPTHSTGGSITFAGNGDLYNEESFWIATAANGSSINFSGHGKVHTSRTSKISDYGRISLTNVTAKCNVSPDRILSFGKYGRFCGKASSPSDVNLNGKLEFTSTNSYFYNLNISSGSGIVDMGKIRECSLSATSVTGLSGNIYDISISSSASPTVYLPFNCKFSNVDLSNASNIYYTILKITKVGVDENIIKKVTGTYGDYADSNNNLGVTLPKNTNGTLNTHKVHITEDPQDEAYMSLSELVDDITTYNISGAGYYLLTDHLDDVADTVAAGATHDYNFGFIGEKAISITPEEEAKNTKATFKGDNRGYNPGTPATISAAEVVFGASDSLFPFSYNYIKGTFTKGNFTNTIPANKTIEFTNGFTLGLGHTLIVSGTLIG